MTWQQPTKEKEKQTTKYSVKKKEFKSNYLSARFSYYELDIG
jgi:hypothetical protein